MISEIWHKRLSWKRQINKVHINYKLWSRLDIEETDMKIKIEIKRRWNYDQLWIDRFVKVDQKQSEMGGS